MDNKTWRGLKSYMSKAFSAIKGEQIRVLDVEPYVNAPGYTSKDKTIHLAREHSLFDGLSEENKINCIIGIGVHELMHQMLTNFTLVERNIVGMSTYESQMFHQLHNIVEDARIEHYAYQFVGGPMLATLKYVIAHTYNTTEKLETFESPLLQYMNALIMFGDLGPLKGHFTYPEAKEAFVKTAPIFDKCIYETSNRKVLKYVKEIFEISRPLWQDEAELSKLMEDMAKEMAKKGKSPSGGASGKPSCEASDDSEEDSSEESKRRKVSMKEFDEAVNNSSSCSGSGSSGSGETLECSPETAEEAREAAEVAKECAKNAKESAKNASDKAKSNPADSKANANATKAEKAADTAQKEAEKADKYAGEAENAKAEGDSKKEKECAKKAGEAAMKASRAAKRADDAEKGKSNANANNNKTAEDAKHSADNASKAADSAKEAAKKAKEKADSEGTEEAKAKAEKAKKAAEKAEKAANQAKEHAEKAEKAKAEGDSETEEKESKAAERAAKRAEKASNGANEASSENGDGDGDGTDSSTDADSKDDHKYDTSDKTDNTSSEVTDRASSGSDPEYDFSDTGEYNEDEFDGPTEFVMEDYELSEDDLEAIESEIESCIEESEMEDVRDSEDKELLEIDIVSPRFKNAPVCLNRNIAVSDVARASELYSRIMNKLNAGVTNLTHQLKRIFKNDQEEKAYRASGKINIKRLNSSRMTSRVFDRRRSPANKSNLSVLLLVDESGSMCGSRSEAAKQCAIALAETMNNVNVPCYVIGFTADTSGADAVHNHYIKWRNSAKDRLRLLDITARANNFDGYSIRYAGEVLKKHNSEHKLMIVISDGQPACSAYRGVNGIADTKEAIRDVRKYASVLGVAIGNDSTEILHSMYGQDFIHISNVNELFSGISKKIAKLIKTWD